MKMSRYNQSSQNGLMCVTTTMIMLMVMALQSCCSAFTLQRPSSIQHYTTPKPSLTSLSALQKGGKFNKQIDLAAKMAEAQRLRELADAGGGAEEEEVASSKNTAQEKILSAAEIKERNDMKRFADLLDNSLQGGGGGDLDKGYYLTEAQENEEADAVHRGVVRLYEGDPAPSTPFSELLNIENGEPIGKGGMKRLLPWEGSKSVSSSDYLVVVTDPRPKSIELRTAMKRLTGAMSADVLKKCLVINTDSPGENRRFIKKNFGEENKDSLKIMCDENLELMREYSALGDKRFSITMFVLRNGRVEKIAREVEAEVLPMVVKNALSSLVN